MNEHTLAVMPLNSLWLLREKIDSLLASKLMQEKQEIERRLALMIRHNQKPRRPYPKVNPKYRNPERPEETWSGRGLKPRWFVARLRAGNCPEDLRIPQ